MLPAWVVSVAVLMGGLAMDAVFERFPVGQEVTAYVNPRNPAQAVLELVQPAVWWERSWPVLVLAVIGICLLLAAYLLPSWR